MEIIPTDQELWSPHIVKSGVRDAPTPWGGSLC